MRALAAPNHPDAVGWGKRTSCPLGRAEDGGRPTYKGTNQSPLVGAWPATPTEAGLSRTYDRERVQEPSVDHTARPRISSRSVHAGMICVVPPRCYCTALSWLQRRLLTAPLTRAPAPSALLPDQALAPTISPPAAPAAPSRTPPTGPCALLLP